MEYIFVNDCAADGCKKKNIGNGKQMCEEHQNMYNRGISFKAFYGKNCIKRKFQINHSLNTTQMERNYITEQCSSVDDLRSHLRCWNPIDTERMNEGITNLQTSIDYEIKHQNRVTIVKMLIAKRNALKKKL